MRPLERSTFKNHITISNKYEYIHTLKDQKCETQSVLGFKATLLDGGRSARIWHENAHHIDKKGKKYSQSFTLLFEKEDLLERRALASGLFTHNALLLLRSSFQSFLSHTHSSLFGALCVTVQVVALFGGTGAHATRGS